MRRELRYESLMRRRGGGMGNWKRGHEGKENNRIKLTQI